MALSDSIVRERLAFIRYLFNTGVELSHWSEPQCALAILTFHDAIELFFGLSCEHLTVTGLKDQTNFNEYWDIIASRLTGSRLAQETSIRRLNKARVALKHHGIRPAKLDVEGLRAASASFFEDNTELVFHIEFSDLSLIELVGFEPTRIHLKQAHEFLKQSRIGDSLQEVAIGFAKLLEDYEVRKLGQGRLSPFGPRDSDAPIYSNNMEFDQLGAGLRFRLDMENFINRTNDAISFMQNNVRILSLGIDYRKYAKFERLTPMVDLHSGKDPYMVWVNIIPPVSIAAEDARFCIDFAIESALRLQGFDHDLKALY